MFTRHFFKVIALVMFINQVPGHTYGVSPHTSQAAPELELEAVQIHPDAALLETEPAETSSAEETIPPENAINDLMEKTPPILVDATLGNLIYGINEAKKGLYLACTNHLAANNDLGLMEFETAYALGNFHLDGYVSYEHVGLERGVFRFDPDQPMEGKKESHGDNSNLQRTANKERKKLFIEDPAVCIRNLGRVIKMLPSIKIDEDIQWTVIIMPWYGTHSGYLMPLGNKGIFVFNIDHSDREIKDTLLKDLGPIMDIEDDTLIQLTATILGEQPMATVSGEEE